MKDSEEGEGGCATPKQFPSMENGVSADLDDLW